MAAGALFALTMGALVLALDGLAGRWQHGPDGYEQLKDVAYLVSLIGCVSLTALLFWRRQVMWETLSRVTIEKEMISRSEQRFNALVRNGSDITAILGTYGEITYVSPAVNSLLGFEPAELVGSPAHDIVHPDDRTRVASIVTQMRNNFGSSTPTEARLSSASGVWLPFEIVITNMLGEPEVAGIMLNCRDISERKEFETQLAHHAFHDSLTGLPNRALFMHLIESALRRSRAKGTSIAVMVIDIDDFKVVNESLGHEIGDRLLVQVADRVQECTGLDQAVSRLGGDEFMILLDDCLDDEARAVAQRIVETLWAPFRIENREVFLRVSIGIGTSSGEYAIADDLLRDAASAMFHAKSAGKSRIAMFEPGMNARAIERLELQTDLNRALNKKQFAIHYQPVVSLADGTVSEVEALLRWNHPTRGMVMPDRFISLAEQTGLIVPLGLWVLEQACRQARAWQIERPNATQVGVNINISPRQLRQPDFIDHVSRILRQTGLPGELLTLEISETFMSQDTETAIPTLHLLKALGVKLTINDFGTGYSSMMYITTLPIDTLKIDRSFIARLGDQDDDAVVAAIVSLAKSLRLRTTSEGIETLEQLAALREVGCDNGQGYYLARPAPPENLTGILASSSGITLFAQEDVVLKAA